MRFLFEHPATIFCLLLLASNVFATTKEIKPYGGGDIELLQEDNPEGDSALLDDMFTLEERKGGYLILHFIGVLYMFIAIAIVCDDYFVSALGFIVENMDIKDDVAGATFMAAGGSAPELFTSVFGLFFVKSDVGFGTIVGSAVFNVLAVISACAVFAGQELPLTWWPLARDCTYYILSLIILTAMIEDQEIAWYESLILLFLYVLYVIMMYYNEQFQAKVTAKLNGFLKWWNRDKANADKENGVPMEEVSGDVEDNGDENGDTSQTENSRQEPKPYEPEEFIDQPVAPTKRMSVSYIMKHKSQLYTSTADVVKEAEEENERSQLRRIKTNTRSIQEDDADDDDDMEDEEEWEHPLAIPETRAGWIFYIIKFPIIFTLFITIPDCRMERFQRHYMLTFFVSLLWIAAFTFLMVWLADIIGTTLGIKSVVMGVTILAAGTSVPDMLSSVLVARQGRGDMAVSSSVGSNLFDILVGLPLPWFIATAFVDPGSVAPVYSDALAIQVATLCIMVLLVFLTIVMFKWRLSWPIGIAFLFLYIIFLLETLGLEYGWFY